MPDMTTAVPPSDIPLVPAALLVAGFPLLLLLLTELVNSGQRRHWKLTPTLRVLRSVVDANVGSIFGWGFAPCHGGTLQFIDSIGAARFVARAQALAVQHGPRFAPPPGLLQRASSGTLAA